METRNLRKVFVYTGEGQTITGFANDGHIENGVTIISRQGKEQHLTLDQVKAIFFVKDFESNSEHVTFFSKLPVRSKVWVRIEFSDGQVVEGKVENGPHLLHEPGFFLWPSHHDGNTELVYVVKSALKNFCFLSAE